MEIKKKILKFQIYDTCEQEKYDSLGSSYYKNSSLAILVYSIDNKKSFENIEKKWLDEIKTNCKEDIKIFLIGNKKDLNVNRVVSFEMGEKLKNDNKFNLFLETSAEENFNEKNIFIKAAKKLYYKNYIEYGNQNEIKSVPHSNEIHNINISNNNNENKNKKSNCCNCCKKTNNSGDYDKNK